MAISDILEDYLSEHNVDYQVVHHPHTYNSGSTAQAAHVPGDRLAKGVILEDDIGFVMAVLPSTYKLSLNEVRNHLNRDVELATEIELIDLFQDCEPGAVPPIGEAFHMDTIVEDDLLDQKDVWLEAGDHREVLHVSGDSFRHLMTNSTHGHIGHHA